MTIPSTASPSRCLTVWLASSGVLGVLTWLLLPDLAAAHGSIAATGLAGQSFERLLAWWCALVATVGCAWLWAVTTLVSLQAARGRAHRPIRGVPAPCVARCSRRAGWRSWPGCPPRPSPHPDSSTPTVLQRPLPPGCGASPLPDRPTGGLVARGPASHPVERQRSGRAGRHRRRGARRGHTVGPGRAHAARSRPGHRGRRGRAHIYAPTAPRSARTPT